MDIIKMWKIGDWHLEPSRNCISGPSGTFMISGNTLEILVFLAEHAGRVISRDELIAMLDQAIAEENATAEDSTEEE
jgi:DNA-binding winged helix-turn-helix (wHTH) protein